ncbi:DEAD/DEAH box helicase [Shewanella sp.]|uniref:DEAD/DEAH box helicase n=1 Tax=Shewanella sp. TaxID=50422 RepID=UPI004053EDB7
MSFSAFNLHPKLQATIAAQKYTEPTPVQQQAIPEITAGQDLLVGAQTGTGKTAAFAIPLVHKLLTQADELLSQTDELAPSKTPPLKVIKALILTPTRELALQVQSNIDGLTQGTDLKSAIAYGGASIGEQVRSFKDGVDILVATPGRLLDHLRHKVVSLKQVEYLVFDEADRMLDMGFKDEIRDLLRQLPKQRQTLLFSATLNDSIFSFSRNLLNQPKVIEVAKANAKVAKIIERVYCVDENRKLSLLCHLISQENWQQVLVFSRTKQGADSLATKMQQNGIAALAFHGDLTQSMRENVLKDFSLSNVQVLVATDVAARGLDIEDLNYVVNYELPYVSEDYIHRIGRTGRAGKDGVAVTLFAIEDTAKLMSLETLLDRRLPQQWYPGFEPDLTKEVTLSRKHTKAGQKQQARRKALGKAKR